MRFKSRTWLLCSLALVVSWSASVRADGPRSTGDAVPLPPLGGDAESFAFGINDRGDVVGHSLRAGGGATAVIWDSAGNPTALLPLPGGDESFAVAINNSGMTVGQSRENRGSRCSRDTAVIWSPDGTALPLLPLSGGFQSVANGISDEGMVAGTSKGLPDRPRVSCEAPFTPVFWDIDGIPTALAPLDGFPEGYASTVTSSGDVVGGSANTTTGFDFQGTIWRSRKHNTRLLRGPAASFLNTPVNGNADGMVVGDSYDYTFTKMAVVWDADGNATLRRPLKGGSESSGRAINRRGEVAGMSLSAAGSTAVRWSRKGGPTALPPLPGDPETEGTAINRSGQVAGHSFGAGASTAVIWRRP